MNDQVIQSAPAASADPLDTNVNDIDTSYPLLPATYYMMKLEGCKVEPNSKGTGENLVLPHKTIEKAQDVKGNEVQPGLVVTRWVSLTETDKRTIDAIKKDVARIAQAFGVNATVRQIINSPASLDGKTARTKVTVKKETDEFPASNGIGGYAKE
jgi:hypothetical protein